MTAHDKNNGEAFGKKGLCVTVRNNNIDRALRRLKKMMADEGIPRELRRREHYERPGEIKRRRASDARRRWLKQQAQLVEERGY